MTKPVVLVVLNRDRLDASLRDELDRLLQRLAASPERIAIPGESASPSVAELRCQSLLRQRAELVGLLEECGGNLAEVARRLGVSRGAVIYRARKFGLLAEASRSRGAAGRSR